MSRSIYFGGEFLTRATNAFASLDIKQTDCIGRHRLSLNHQQLLLVIKQMMFVRYFGQHATIIEVLKLTECLEVRVLGFIQFKAYRHHGIVSAQIYTPGLGFRDTKEATVVEADALELCLPLPMTLQLASQMVKVVHDEMRVLIDAVANEQSLSHDQIIVMKNSLNIHLIRWLRSYVKKHVDWKRFRYTVLKSLQLDAVVYRLALRASMHHKRVLSVLDYRRVKQYQAAYMQCERDNPQLLWLLHSLSDVVVDEKEPTKSLKKAMLKKGVTPKEWAILSRSNRRQLATLFSEDSELKNVCLYVQMLRLSKLEAPLPSWLMHKLMAGQVGVSRDGVELRGACMPYRFFKMVIDQYLCHGRDVSYVDQTVADVLYWLKFGEPKLDNHQLRKPWAWFVKQANQFIGLEQVRGAVEKNIWDPFIHEAQIDEYHVQGISNRWELVRLSMQQRHCVDAFAKGCMNETRRVFVIKRLDKVECTVVFNLLNGYTQINDVRQFANKRATFAQRQVVDKLQTKLNATMGFKSVRFDATGAVLIPPYDD